MTDQTCETVLSKLDEWVDGTSDEADGAMIEAHLEACPDCRAEERAVRELVDHARSLPRSVEPESDLWPGIAARIESRRVVRAEFSKPATGRRWWTMAAAAAVLVLSVSLAYMAGLERAQRTATVTPTEVPGVMQAAYGDLASDLELARDQLRENLERRRGELTEETWSVVMDNMGVIDDAIDRIELALADNPGDERLNRQLTGAYRRQIALLQRAATLPAEV